MPLWLLQPQVPQWEEKGPGEGLEPRARVCGRQKDTPETVQSGRWCWARNLRDLPGMMLQKTECRQKAMGSGEAAGMADNKWQAKCKNS